MNRADEVPKLVFTSIEELVKYQNFRIEALTKHVKKLEDEKYKRNSKEDTR